MMKSMRKSEKIILKTAVFVAVVWGVVLLALSPGKAEASSCYSTALVAYVDGRIPTAKTDRWERIKAALYEQDGAMSLEEAERILENRERQRLFLEYMDEVVAAIKCLAEEPEIDTRVVDVEDPPGVGGGAEDPGSGTAPTWPGTQPQEEEAQDQSPASFTNFRTYIHTEPLATTNVEYRINEDDRWEAELIVHFESSIAQNLSGELCVNHDIWNGNEYWNNGPITLPGFTDFVNLKYSNLLQIQDSRYGHWQCTGSINADPTPPNFTILNPRDDGDDGNTSNDDGIVEFIYRAKIRTRDNNVVEDDFRLTDLEFRYVDGLTGKTQYRTETETLPDRDSWWRMNLEDEAFPDTHNTYCLGTGSAWVQFTPLRCKDLRPSKYIDRAPRIGNSCDKSHSDYVVRADVSEADWLPDGCFSTKVVPKIPPTPPNSQPTTFDNTSLPIIEEDDVSYIKLHKVNGEWTVSLSKPVMVTDGEDCSAEEAAQQAELDQLIADARAKADGTVAKDRAEKSVRRAFKWSFDSDCDIWWKTDQGLILAVNSSVANSSGSIDLLIPAVNGIVKDIDYKLHELQKVTRDSDSDAKLINNPSTDIETVGPYSEACDYQNEPGGEGVPRKYLAMSARAHGMVSGGGTHMEVTGPPLDSNLCN